MSPADTSTTNPGGTETVTVVTPVKDSKVASDFVAVSGQTKKNSKVVYLLNGANAGSSITDDTGLFTKTLTGITQESNILRVQVLDGTDAIIGQSDDVSFGRAMDTAGVYNLVITPGSTVNPGSPINFMAEGDSGMLSASILLDGSIITLQETQPGKYTTSTVAPAKPGTYSVDVSMVSPLGKTLEKKAAASLTVTEAVASAPQFYNVRVQSSGDRATFTFSVINPPADLSKFKIAYGENPDSLSREVITYTTDRIGSGGTYSWYVGGLESKNYTFKIFGMRADGTLIQNLVSDPVNITVSNTVSSCTIGNV